MPKDRAVPKDDDGKALWLKNFADKLGTYAASVGWRQPK
jgi:hypothetical protein